MPASWRSCRPMRRPWAGPSCAGAWRPSSGPTGRRSSPGSTRRPRSPPRWARSIARPWRTAPRSRPSCNIPTWRRPWRPTSTSSSSCSRSASASIPAIRTDEIHAEITNRLREELDYRREARHVALYRHMLRDEPAVHVPEVVPSHLDRPPAHHDLAAGRAAAELEEPLAGGDGPARRQHVPRLVRAVLFLRRDPRRSASRQLHGARRRLGEPDGFRLRADLPAALRARLDRALSRADDRRPRPRRRGLRGLGLQRADAAR